MWFMPTLYGDASEVTAKKECITIASDSKAIAVLYPMLVLRAATTSHEAGVHHGMTASSNDW
jgi:hypothetical protein